MFSFRGMTIRPPRPRATILANTLATSMATALATATLFVLQPLLRTHRPVALLLRQRPLYRKGLCMIWGWWRPQAGKRSPLQGA